MALTKFRYQLDSGSKKFRCPACQKKRFVRYVDSEDGNYLPEDVGRCDRELNCGYHKPPREADGLSIGSALYSMPEPPPEPVPSYISKEYLERSLGKYERNSLIRWMATLKGWSWALATDTAKEYRVGTSSDGWAIFWQIDQEEKIRSGKMMAYSNDGHRIKEGYSQDWIHSKLKRSGHLNDFELVQCFYGLHLLDDRPVAIVESEKTAIIASQYLTQFTWMASGQLNGINEYKMQPLKGRKVVLFPDIGCFNQWNDKALELAHMADISVSTLLEENAPDQHKGYDIADYLIEYDLRDFSPHGWNPFTGEIFDDRGYPKSWDDV
ncbi:DUF6371 domain-containing protein [Rhodohalobacter halophilus]|uniref:DUF6371 domain-containing protein n=1 Tax=Rhodohalobacter halophilus TaxID=1812810 RepID=UPI00083FD182|nr:DUF6371 domain-containing protein [Rhodohalobacter halophilus]